MPDCFKPSLRVFFSCLLLSQIFALVYPLGNLTVESQDRKRSMQYLKYPSSDLKLSPINRDKKLGLVNDICRIELWPSPRVCFHVSRISESLLLTPFLVFVSRVTRSILHNIHYLNFETRLKTIWHMNGKGKGTRIKNNKESMHYGGAVPESRLGLPPLY